MLLQQHIMNIKLTTILKIFMNRTSARINKVGFIIIYYLSWYSWKVSKVI